MPTMPVTVHSMPARKRKSSSDALPSVRTSPRSPRPEDAASGISGPVWSLFSGAMGLDLGLEQAGLRSSLCVEIDRWCCETIRLNRPDAKLVQDDVRALTGTDLRKISGVRGDVFLMVGGPPCQSFSPGGNRAGLSDPRGNLILEYFRLISEVQPRYFVFENVANLVTAALNHRAIADRPGKMWNLSAYTSNRTMNSDDGTAMRDDELSGSAFRFLLQEIGSLGYRFTFGVLDAAEHGAPQRRFRFVMIGSRAGNPPELPKPTHGLPRLHPFRTLRDAIADLAEPGFHYQYTPGFREIFALVPPGGNWRNLPRELQAAALGNSYAAGGGKTGFFRKLSWDQPAPTITGKPNRKGSALCHPSELRPLSVRECARLQGLPDNWVLCGSAQEQYRQIGNAVPTALGEAIGRQILGGMPATDEALEPARLLAQAARKLRNSARNKKTHRPEEPTLFDELSA